VGAGDFTIDPLPLP